MTQNVVEIRNLTRRFRRKVALDGVDLEIPSGAVFGLVGENGAGKTTLIKHILGLFRAKTGTVRVFGLDPVKDPPGVLGRIGYLSEDRDLPDWMTVRELIRYTQAFYPSWDDSFSEALLETFGLDPLEKIRDLSRGQRAQSGLLVALAHRPDLLVLDEPSSGLDPIVRKDILGAIVRTVAEEGRTVLFSSHLLDEVERVADRVALIHSGKMALSESMDRIKETHRRLTVRFEQPREVLPELPGMLSGDGSGLEWSLICNGRFDELKAAIAGLGGQVVEEGVPTLEEVFVARVK